MSDIIKNALDFFIIAGAIQGFFLAFIFFSIKRGNKKANRMLAFLLLSFSISIIHAVTGNILQQVLKSIIKIDGHFQLLFGPFFYFYIKYLTDRLYKFSKKEILHFIPFVVVSLFLFINSLILFEINFNNHRVINLFLWGITSIHLWTYLIIICRKIIIRYNKNIKKTFSNIDKINLKWIWFFIHSLIICHILYFLLLPLLVHFPDPYQHFNKIVTIIIACLIYGLGYRGLKQPEIFIGITGSNDKQNSSIKYQKSSLKESEIEVEFKKLQQIIENKKIYKDPELTLNDLSNELNISAHNLSQIINSKTDSNFYDFINSYRVEEVKKLLTNPDNVKRYTLLSLAFDAGFNSKATFNKMFKKVTGLTPSEFVKIN